MKNKMKVAKITAIFVAILGVTLLGSLMGGPKPAAADVYTGGASGGTSGGSGSGSGLRWHYYGPNIASINSPNGVWSNTPVYGRDGAQCGNNAPVCKQIVQRAMRDLQSSCNATDVIAVFGQYHRSGAGTNQFSWWAKQGFWHHNQSYQDLANLYRLSGGTNHQVVVQLEEIGAVRVPEKTVICVTASKNSIQKWGDVPIYEPVTNTQATTCRYSRRTAVNRQISGLVAGRRGDPIGVNNLEDQAGRSVKTPFGVLYDDFMSRPQNARPDPDSAKAQLEAACKKSSESGNVNLSQNNKDGLAEGGVLNVTEWSRYGSYTSTQSYEELKHCFQFLIASEDNGVTWRPIGAKDGCANPHPRIRNVSNSSVGNVRSTQNATGFWQMISVHCNKAEFDKLIQETGATVKNATLDPSGKYSALAYSKKYNSVPARPDFGDSGAPSRSAKFLSSRLGFYDKECPFDCTAEPSSQGAISTHPGSNNAELQAIETKTATEKEGAVSGTNNTNSFSFFRDNKEHDVQLYGWYPKDVNGVRYTGANDQNVSTTINRWSGGTPRLDGSNGGKFTMYAKDGTKKTELFTGKGSLTNERNWSESTLNTPTATSISGFYNTFAVKGSWSSDTNRPQVVNVKWEYKPQIRTTVTSGIVGFNSTGSALQGSFEERSASVEGKCYAQFGTDSGLDTTKAFGDFTGTGTRNDLDGKLFGRETTPPTNDTSNLIFNFIRATTE